MNPTSYAWLIYLIVLCITKYFVGKGEKLRSWVLVAVALITIVYYIYGMRTFFPSRIPYVYNPRNLTNFLLKTFYG